MRFLLRLSLAATLAFLVLWLAHPSYQRAIGALAARLAAPRGGSIEIVDLETFFPFDLGIYLALCAASDWVSWRARLRAVVFGLPALALVELLALVGAMRAVIADPGSERAMELGTGIVRVVGMVAPVTLWLVALARDRVVPLVRRARR